MSGRRMAGAVAGGLLAGLGITAMLLAGEKKSGKPSELADLKRAAGSKLGLGVPPAKRLPSTQEQAVIQGGHLLLSAIAAAAYAATTDDEAGTIPSGVAFGLAFYAIAHWIVGPALGVKAPEWRADRGTLGMHAANHIAFGLVTAGAARAADRIQGATA